MRLSWTIRSTACSRCDVAPSHIVLLQHRAVALLTKLESQRRRFDVVASLLLLRYLCASVDALPVLATSSIRGHCFDAARLEACAYRRLLRLGWPMASDALASTRAPVSPPSTAPAAQCRASPLQSATRATPPPCLHGNPEYPRRDAARRAYSSTVRAEDS